MLRKRFSGRLHTLVVGLMLIAGGATAELQNVIINGSYSLKEESRVAQIFPVAVDESGQSVSHIIMATHEMSRQASSAYLRKVVIPARLTPDSYKEGVKF